MVITPEDVQLQLSKLYTIPVSEITQIGQGVWSQAFFFTVTNENKVLRFSAYDEDFARDSYASRFTSDAMPIPAIEKAGAVFGGFYAISPKAEGSMLETISREEMLQTLPALKELFNSLRSADTSASTGFGNWDRQGNGPDATWKESLQKVASADSHTRLLGWKEKLAGDPKISEIFDQSYQTMLSLLPFCPEERHVIHNDLLHFNLIVKDGYISAVIDWGCALYGDFLYDLAMFITWQFIYPAIQGIDFITEMHDYYTKQGVDLTHFEERIKCYELHLLLDALVYNFYKDDRENLDLVLKRLSQVNSN